MKENKLKVLIVRRRDGIGGIEKASETLAQSFTKFGHEAHLYTIKERRSKTIRNGVFYHYTDLEKIQRKKPIGLLLYLFSRVFLRFIFPESLFIWQGIYCSHIFKRKVWQLEKEYGKFDLILIRGRGSIELVWNYKHQNLWYMFESVNSGFKTFLGEFYNKLLYKNKKVVYVSNGIKQQLHNQLDPKLFQREETIYNLVPFNEIIELSKQPCAQPIEVPYIIHVARLAEVKNQNLLLHAYAIARSKSLIHRLVIIGGGENEKTLKNLAKELKISSFVDFLGPQKNPYPWMRNASALVLTSKSEGLGLVLIEALGLGTLCISNDCPGGIREVLTGGLEKYIATYNDTNDLADKIIDAVSDPLKIPASSLNKFRDETVINQFKALLSN